MQRFQVGVAAVHFFVEHHAVEAFARRVGQQFFRERNVFLAGEAKTVNDFAQFVFRRLDAFGNFHLLLAGQQRHRAHLLEIHPHRIVQRIQPAVVFLRFILVSPASRWSTSAASTTSISSSRSLAKTWSKIAGRGEFLRQHFVDIVEGQLALLLGAAGRVP